MDAITLLKQDHKKVKGLFQQFDKAGDNAYEKKRQIVEQVIEELSVHASIEEQLFYPAARAAVHEAEDDVLESLEEHHIVKWVLSELDGMDPKAERYDAKVTVLKENVLHHAEEEEAELFPKVRAAMGRKDLQALGEKMEKAKDVAPTKPHPRSPDSPPANLVTGPAAGVVDKARQALRGGGKSRDGRRSSGRARARS
jgi:hemerythrin superfamily protein